MAQRNLTFVARIASGNSLFDYDIRDLDFVPSAQGLRLYASNGVSGGVATYAVSASGAAFVDLDSHARGTTLRSGQAVVLEETGQLVQSGASAGVAHHDISAAGSLSAASALAYLQPDGLHPNEDGVRILAEAIGPFVVQLTNQIRRETDH